MNPKLEQLLALQEQDTKRIDAEAQLARIPQELTILEDKLIKERDVFAQEKQNYQKLEVERKDLDNRLRTAEEQLVQCKTKQSLVKKEDEYNALNSEIATLTNQGDNLETEELELLMRLDDEKKALADKEDVFKKREADLQAQIRVVKEKKEKHAAELSALQEQCKALEIKVDIVFLEAYNDAKRRAKKAPFVVKLDDTRCGGCHLKVSNEIAKAARDSGVPHNCDNCGRLVYA